MAAVTGPGIGYPPPARNGRRRGWLLAVVGGWCLILAGAVLWSVRNDPPTVAEQRDLGQAVPDVRRAAGAVLAAAQDERWVVRLGELRTEDCSVTPVRKGRIAARDVTVYVPEGNARAALDGIAEGLPEEYRASVVAMRGGARLSLYADAGEFVGVYADAQAAEQVLTIEVDSGCRPDTGAWERADPPAGTPPDTLAEVTGAVQTAGDPPGEASRPQPSGGSPSGAGSAAPGAPETSAVTCPEGGTAATFVVDGGPGDPADGPRGVPVGTTPVWSGAAGWAYRMGSESVVITTRDGRLRVSVTTGCRAG